MFRKKFDFGLSHVIVTEHKTSSTRRHTPTRSIRHQECFKHLAHAIVISERFSTPQHANIKQCECNVFFNDHVSQLIIFTVFVIKLAKTVKSSHRSRGEYRYAYFNNRTSHVGTYNIPFRYMHVIFEKESHGVYRIFL